MIVDLLRALRASRLVKRDRDLESTWEIIWWWEARRIPFNIIVGVTGVVSSVAILIIAAVGERAMPNAQVLPDPPIFLLVPVILFGVMANVCYTGGWIVELLVKYAWPAEPNGFGTLSFTLGVVFAVLVTLLPIPLYGGLLLLVYVFEL